MPPTELTITCTVTGVRVACRLCRHSKIFVGPDLSALAGQWARPHLKPFVVASRMSVNGIDQGWQVWR